MNLSELWATRQGRIRIILIAIILATVPCYCSGLIIMMINPQTGTPTPTVETITPTHYDSPTSTPPTLIYFSSPTITRTATITQTPAPSKTYAMPPTLTPSRTTVPSDTPTLEPSFTLPPTMTDTLTILDTETPTPTP
jgi:hypothetical protein